MKSAKELRANGKERLRFPTVRRWHECWATWTAWRLVRSYQHAIREARAKDSTAADEDILAGYFRRALLLYPPDRPPIRDVRTKREEGDARTIARTKPTRSGKGSP